MQIFSQFVLHQPNIVLVYRNLYGIKFSPRTKRRITIKAKATQASPEKLKYNPDICNFYHVFS